MAQRQSDWKSDLVKAWTATRTTFPLTPTDQELHRLIDMAIDARASRPCPSCGFTGKACGFCRRVVPPTKGMPEDR